MKLKKLFQGTFEQSKKIVKSRKWLLNEGDSQLDYSSYLNRILSVILIIGFTLMSYSFIYLSLDSRGKNLTLAPNTGNNVYYIGIVSQPFFIIVSILLALITLRILFPFKNIAKFMNNGWVLMPLWIFSVLLSVLPLLLGLSLGNSGVIATIVSGLVMINFEIYHFRSWLMDSLQKMYGTKEKLNIFDKLNKKLLPIDHQHEFKTFLRLIGIFFIIGICGIIETNGQVGPAWTLRLLIGVATPVVCLMLLELLLVCFSIKLSWYYIKKYPTEYRLYYKISDKLWYLGEKRAAKHPHVYGPEDENKINSNEI